MFRSLFKLAGGIVIGTAVGVAVASVLAPKRGEELQADIRAYLDGMRNAGLMAEAQRRQELQGRFQAAKSATPSEIDINVHFNGGS